MAFRNLLCVCVVVGLGCALGGCVAQADYDAVKSRLQSVGAELQKSQDELGQTKDALKKAQDDREKARSDLANERENLTGQVRLAKDEAVKLKTQRDGLTTLLQDAQGKVQSLEADAKKNQQTQARVANELTEAKAEVKELRGQILTLQAKIKEQDQAIQQLEAKLQDWRAGIAPKNLN